MVHFQARTIFARQPHLGALYMMLLLRTATSPATILTFSGAVYLYHTLAGYPSPTEHQLVRMAREVARRTKLAGQNTKRPFLASHIRRIHSLWAGPSATLHQLMKTVAITLCFTGFLRCSDLLRINWHEVRFVGQSHMEFFLEKSKTDQYRVGTWVLVARVGGPLSSGFSRAAAAGGSI